MSTRPNLPPLTLHVPEPKFRPGDSVDYSDLVIPPAGSAPRPEIDARADSFHELAYSLVRVLDENGKAVGPWAPRLSPARQAELAALLYPLTGSAGNEGVRRLYGMANWLLGRR